jgi:hypothetical protein
MSCTSSFRSLRSNGRSVRHATRTSRLIAFSCFDKLSKAVLSDLYLSMIFSLTAAKMLWSSSGQNNLRHSP